MDTPLSIEPALQTGHHTGTKLERIWVIQKKSCFQDSSCLQDRSEFQMSCEQDFPIFPYR